MISGRWGNNSTEEHCVWSELRRTPYWSFKKDFNEVLHSFEACMRIRLRVCWSSLGRVLVQKGLVFFLSPWMVDVFTCDEPQQLTLWERCTSTIAEQHSQQGWASGTCTGSLLLMQPSHVRVPSAKVNSRELQRNLCNILQWVDVLGSDDRRERRKDPSSN